MKDPFVLPGGYVQGLGGKYSNGKRQVSGFCHVRNITDFCEKVNSGADKGTNKTEHQASL